jgi:CBS domain-containing protein
MKIRELMTPDPETLEPEMTLRDAIERLTNIGVSGAPVVTNEWLVGVLSISDIVEFESANPGVPTLREQQEWGEWAPSERLEEDFTEPFSGWFRDMWADSGADVLERVTQGETPEWDFLSEHIVGEVMTRRVLSLSPDADVEEAARLMVDRGVHRLIVTEGDALRGIVSTMDFLRAIAEGKIRT